MTDRQSVAERSWESGKREKILQDGLYNVPKILS